MSPEVAELFVVEHDVARFRFIVIAIGKELDRVIAIPCFFSSWVNAATFYARSSPCVPVNVARHRISCAAFARVLVARVAHAT
jgi:hypothetical protein